MIARACLLFCALNLAACSGQAEFDLQQQARVTLSPDMFSLYQQTCANCHESDATGAPVTGNTAQWQQVFNKPFDLIVDRVINGYAGMPPLGQCFQCDQSQLEQLIHFMSRPASPATSG